MVKYRCTKRVLAKMPEHEEGPPQGDNNLGDWYVNHLNIVSKRFLLCVAGNSLLTIIVEAKDLSTFPMRLELRLVEMLRILGVSERAIEQERLAMQAFRFLPTNSRSILGSMNDFSTHIDFHWRHSGDLLDCQMRIAEMPCSPLDWTNPDEATRKLFGLSGRWPKKL